MDRLAYWILLGVLLWAPVPLGSNRPWAWLLLSLLIAVAVALLALDRLRSGRGVRGCAITPWRFGAMFLGFVGLQLVPLPFSWLQVLSPQTATAIAAIPNTVTMAWHPLSIDPGATFERLVILFAYMGAFILAATQIDSRARMKRFIVVLILAAALNAIYGLLNYLNVGLFGFFRPAAYWTDAVTGTYVNKNHFAGFMEMVFPVAMAGVAVALHREGGRRSGMMALWVAWPQLFAAVFIGSALALSGSRAGALILLALLVAGFWGYLVSVDVKRSMRAGFGLAAFAAILLVFLWQGGLGRLLSSDLAGSRTSVWADTLSAFSEYWLFGSGGGTYRWVFPQFKSAAIDPLIYDHAHNGYLELLLEYGVIGAVLMAGFVGTALWRGITIVTGVRDEQSRLLHLGLLLGVLAMLLHELVDFNLAIPANGVVFFAMLGVLSGTAHHRRRVT